MPYVEDLLPRERRTMALQPVVADKLVRNPG